jgi:hypothetical protein
MLSSGCVSTQGNIWPTALLRTQISNLRESCRINERSGFSADLSVADQGSAKIEAVWDSSGNLDGQVINALGEDILNFRIDSAGILQTDTSVQQGAMLGSALDFLAELGTVKTRLLICSGLFLAGNEETGNSFGRENAKVEFNLETHSSKWRLSSQLISKSQSAKILPDELHIVTNVSKPELFFSKSVAVIEWQGKKQGNLMKPQSLSVNSARLKIRLSILDFD